MFPYTRYLHCLFVSHNRRFDVISGKLRACGVYLSTDALSACYYQHFFYKLPEHLRLWFNNDLPMHSLHHKAFYEVVLFLKIGKFFNGRSIDDRFDGILKNRLIHRHIECSLIGRLTPEEISADINDTYHVSLHPHIIEDFRELFMDLSFVSNQNEWSVYMKSLPRDEQIFRNAILLQPRDYVRWKLGVRVSVDIAESLHEIASDMFWRYKESLADNCIETSRRIADTAMKAMDKLGRLAASENKKIKQKNFNALLLSFSDDNAETINDIQFNTAEEAHADETTSL